MEPLGTMHQKNITRENKVRCPGPMFAFDTTHRIQGADGLDMQHHWRLVREQRYALWFTALFASGFVQGALFVTGDACHHEPAPAQCEGGALLSVANIASAFWGTLLTSPLVYLLFWLFNRPFTYGSVTALEKERFLKQWSRNQRCGWMSVVVVNSIFAALILRLCQFYPWGLVKRWISGLCTSSFSGIAGSVTTRALLFIRFFFIQLAQSGGSTW